MKVAIYTDVHFSQDSSIVRGMGKKYSKRLEYLIESLNWAEGEAERRGCSAVFNLGDMFDRPTLNAMELTALKEIKWANVRHFVLVGNHDSNLSSLEYSSSEVLSKLDNFEIVSRPQGLLLGKTMFHLIPYITEDNRKPLQEYLKATAEDKESADENMHKNVILSHNDIKGMQLGKYLSQEGFDKADIEKNCDLFLNGHIHNMQWLSTKILNCGNLCGMNFSEDAFKYPHNLYILDTDILSITPIENPHALNFCKIVVDEEHPLKSYELKRNSVLMIQADGKKVAEETERDLAERDVVAYKIVLHDTHLGQEKETRKIEKLDYLKAFRDNVLTSVGNNDTIKQELDIICK